MNRPLRAERPPRPQRRASGIRTLLAVVTSVTLLLFSAVSAAASCIRDDRPLPAKVAEAEIVFVGKVLAVDDAGRTALVQVEEIWKGPELDEQVVVHGGPDGASFTSVDRYWEPGARYLVFPRRDDGRLEDDACSPTLPWEAHLAALRPDVTSPVEQQPGRVTTTARPTEWVFVGVAVIVLIVGIGALVARHARRPPSDG